MCVCGEISYDIYCAVPLMIGVQSPNIISYDTIMSYNWEYISNIE